MHIYGIQKNGIDEPCSAAIETQMQRTDVWTQLWREKVGQTERVVLKHIPYVKQIASGNLLQDAGRSTLLCDNLEG